MDFVDAKTRSRMMRSVRSKNTAPEMAVRRAAHALGYRFRLHRLPGRPDIVCPRFRVVIFVHGCFWHSHDSCSRSSIPATNRDFWAEKLARNVERDQRNMEDIRNLGWRAGIIWGCETKDTERLRVLIANILSSKSSL